MVEEQVSTAREAGYTLVEPAMVLMTHLSEIVRQQSSNLLTRAETERLTERVKEQDPGLVDELIPGVMSYTDVQNVLQNLLRAMSVTEPPTERGGSEFLRGGSGRGG